MCFLCGHTILLSCAITQSVQLLSRVRLLATPWTAARQASLSITNSRSLLKLMSIESVMLSNHLSSPSPPTLNLSQHQGLFQWVGSSHQAPKVCLIPSVNLSVSTSLCLSIHHLSLYYYLCVATFPAIYLASICLCIYFNLSVTYVHTYLSGCVHIYLFVQNTQTTAQLHSSHTLVK